MEIGDKTVVELFGIEVVCPNTSIQSGIREHRVLTESEEGRIDQFRILFQLKIITGPIEGLEILGRDSTVTMEHQLPVLDIGQNGPHDRGVK